MRDYTLECVLVAQATAKLYAKIMREAAVAKINFFKVDSIHWIITCKTPNLDDVVFNTYNDCLLDDNYHNQVCAELRGRDCLH